MGSIGFNTDNALTVNGVQPNWGMKNYIINGNFDIWQYKDAGYPYPQVTQGYRSVDRWLTSASVSTFSVTQVATDGTEPFNADFYLRNAVTHLSGGTVYFEQKVEGLKRLSGKTLTASFYVKANASKTIRISPYMYYGASGSPQTAIVTSDFQVTSEWKKVTLTFEVPTAVGKTFDVNNCLRFTIYLDGPTLDQSGTFDFAQFQLEEGSVATPFEQRPYGLELSLCQRYYETGVILFRGYSASGAGSQTFVSKSFKVTKRVTPTMSQTITANINCTPSISPYSNSFLTIGGTVTAAGMYYAGGTWTASAEI